MLLIASPKRGPHLEEIEKKYGGRGIPQAYNFS